MVLAAFPLDPVAVIFAARQPLFSVYFPSGIGSAASNMFTAGASVKIQDSVKLFSIVAYAILQ